MFENIFECYGENEISSGVSPKMKYKTIPIINMCILQMLDMKCYKYNLLYMHTE